MSITNKSDFSVMSYLILKKKSNILRAYVMLPIIVNT